MTVTAQRLLTELGHRAWSGFNEDDMIFNSDEANQAKAELNSALRYLINLEDFPFRSKEENIMAMRNIAEYDTPDGQISSVYNSDTLKTLEYIGDNLELDKNLKGEPKGYWINTDNPTQNIRLFPIPDKKYNFNIVFNQYKPVMGADGEAKFEFETAEDIINIPEKLEYLFMDCLVLRAMVTNNKDQEDENYVPTINEFNQAWKVFKNACNPVKKNYRVVW